MILKPTLPGAYLPVLHARGIQPSRKETTMARYEVHELIMSLYFDESSLMNSLDSGRYTMKRSGSRLDKFDSRLRGRINHLEPPMLAGTCFGWTSPPLTVEMCSEIDGFEQL